jgi:hypothetical protein
MAALPPQWEAERGDLRGSKGKIRSLEAELSRRDAVEGSLRECLSRRDAEVASLREELARRDATDDRLRAERDAGTSPYNLISLCFQY